MTGTRLLLPGLAVAVLAAPAPANWFGQKKPDAARVKHLTETLRTDPDEKKRKAAVAELREADPRTQPEVIPALVGALQRDPSAAVRADAAEAVGQFKLMFPIAGVALESAAESDPSPAVRDASQRSLWEYHLIGYRSTRGTDGIAGQTPEPPIAKPPAPRQPVVPVGGPAPKPVNPPAAVPPLPPAPAVPTNPLPAVNPPRVGPRVPTILSPLARLKPPAEDTAPRMVISAAPPPVLNVTAEPPIAKPAAAPPAPAKPPVIPPPEGLVPAVPQPGPPPVTVPPLPPIPGK